MLPRSAIMSANDLLHRRSILKTFVTGLIAVAGQRIVSAQGESKRQATRFQIACMTLPYSQYPLERALSGIKAAGFQYVALYLSHKEAGESKAISLLPPDSPPAKAKEIGQRCRDAGLTPLLIFSGIYPEDPKGIEVLTSRIKQAAAAEIKQVLTFGHTSGNNRKVWVERFKGLGPIARDHDVMIVVKQHGETGQVTGEIVR